jgi:hypothetical protein
MHVRKSQIKNKEYRYTPIKSSGMRNRVRRIEQQANIKAPQEHIIPSASILYQKYSIFVLEYG